MLMRETRLARRVFWVIAAVYVLACLAVGVYTLRTGGLARALGGLLAPAVLLLFPLAQRVLRLKPVYPLQSLLTAFVLLALPLGIGLSLYARVGWYDLAVHAASGVVTALLGACGYILLLPDGRGWRAQSAAAATAALGLTALVAVVWELLEYAVFVFTGHDSQWVAQTGVGDTMEDMLAALLGGVVVAVLLWRHGKRPLRLLAPVDAFARENGRG